ncbi:MAG: sigma-70 family RNA polymerase sigma factor [Chloroflexota bacterium]
MKNTDLVSDTIRMNDGQSDSLAYAELEALYEQFFDPIYRYCYLRLGNATLTEEAVSEIFLKVVHKFRSYRGENLSGWLYRIARNQIIDSARKHQREHIDPFADYEHVASYHTPEAAVLSKETLAALRRALDALPKKQREVIELYMAGWTLEQTGTMLGKSPSAIKMLRHRAFTRLRSLLSDE